LSSKERLQPPCDSFIWCPEFIAETKRSGPHAIGDEDHVLGTYLERRFDTGAKELDYE
jgi:hypothetical protein